MAKSEVAASSPKSWPGVSFHQNVLLMLLEAKTTGGDRRSTSRLPSPASYFLNNNNHCYYNHKCCHFWRSNCITSPAVSSSCAPQATPLGLPLRASPARQSSEPIAFVSWSPRIPGGSPQGLFIQHHHLLGLAQICVLNKTKPKKFWVLKSTLKKKKISISLWEFTSSGGRYTFQAKPSTKRRCFFRTASQYWC